MATTGNVLGITGAFGYIGRRLLRRLQEAVEFDRILCTDIADPPEALPAPFFFEYCDVRDADNLYRVFRDAGVNLLVHLAFIAEPTRDFAFEYDVDVGGTQNILDVCDRLVIEKLVVASSDCAYGFFADTPDSLTEDTPLRPTPGFPYAENKTEIEKRIADFADSHPRCSVVVLRPCMVMGPNADNVTSRSMKGPVIVGFRGCDPVMQFIHEDDAAEAFYQALIQPVSGTF